MHIFKDPQLAASCPAPEGWRWAWVPIEEVMNHKFPWDKIPGKYAMGPGGIYRLMLRRYDASRNNDWEILR